MDALLEGTQQQLKGTPIRYGHCDILQLDDRFEVFEHKNITFVSNKKTLDMKNK